MSQKDYEDLYTGDDIYFEYRYSDMLTVLAVTFLYSGAMPIMYPVAAIFFFITYWIDKCLLLRRYKKPTKLDYNLAKRITAFFKYIAMGHMIGFLFMYGQTHIFKNDLFDHFETDRSILIFYFWLIATILSIFLIRTIYQYCRYYCCRVD